MVTADGASTGTEFQSRIACGKYECSYVSVLEWGTWSLSLCPLEPRVLGSSGPSAGLTSTRPFMELYIMQTLSDVLLDQKFPSWSWVTRAEVLEVGLMW